MIRNLCGMKFGRLTVVEFDSIRNHLSYWKCICECGNEKVARRKTLVNGGTTSCGCYNKERIHQSCFHDITGGRFGRLTAISNHKKSHRTYWKCLCDCGNESLVDACKLKSGHTKSCGCLLSQVSSIRAIERNKKMRGDKHPFWRSDLSDEERKRRIEGRFSDPKLNRWRKKIYERDGYTCQKCSDDKGGNLVAHHIYSWACYPKLRYVKNNGITLCEKCHKNFHNVYGNKKNTRKQLSIFMSKNNQPTPRPTPPPKITPKPTPPRPTPIPPKREETPTNHPVR